MYKENIKQLRGLVNLNATAFEILLILVELMDKENAILISYSAMMQITKKSRQTCSKAVGDLQDSNFIKVIKSGSSNAVSYTHLDVYKRQALGMGTEILHLQRD